MTGGLARVTSGIPFCDLSRGPETRVFLGRVNRWDRPFNDRAGVVGNGERVWMVVTGGWVCSGSEPAGEPNADDSSCSSR